MALPRDKILLVDDEQLLLDCMRQSHRKVFALRTALGAEKGLEILQNEGPFPVVVADHQMPGMNGITFLARVREVCPETVRVLLTGSADLRAAMDAVNRGEIFRILSKPCEEEVFRTGVRGAIEQYDLRRAEKSLLEDTLQGCLEVLTDVLSLSNPEAFGRATRVRTYVRQVAEHMELEHGWRYETAALLSQIGLISVPDDLIEKVAAGESLSEPDEQVLEGHPRLAHDMLVKVPRLNEVARMILRQRTRHNELDALEAEEHVALGSRILAAALDFDEYLSVGAGRRAAVEAMRTREGAYDPEVLAALAQVEPPGRGAVSRALEVRQLRAGMILEQDVVTENGALVVAGGNTITPGMLARIRNHAELRGIPGTIRVLVPTVGPAEAA